MIFVLLGIFSVVMIGRDKKLFYVLIGAVLVIGCSHRNYPTSSTGPTTVQGDLQSPSSWHFPLPGAKIISPYGQRGGRMHTGADLKTKAKDRIYAAFAGEVVFSGRSSGYGNLVRINHGNGLETYYAHNSKNMVKKGQHVKAGQVIALVGQTGRATTPHLHFETRINGKPQNPANYFDLSNGVLRKKGH